MSSAVPAMWPHQADALRFVEERRAAGAQGSLVAADMGVGKTRVAVERIARSGAGFTLIVCPKMVVPVWAAELERWWPEGVKKHRVVVHPGGPPKRTIAELGLEVRAPLILVANYESIFGRESRLGVIVKRVPWDLIVADEAHRLKAPNGKTSRQIAKLAERTGAERLGLTGTPMPQTHLDAYGLMRFVDPEVFENRTYTMFRARYSRQAMTREDYENPMRLNYRARGGGIETIVPDNMDEFERRLADGSWRVAARDVHDLPEALDQNIYIELGDTGARAYREMSEKLIAEVENGYVTAANGAVKVMRLQQIASGFATEEDSGGVIRVGSEKKYNGFSTVLDMIPPHEPVVVFCRFKQELSDIRDVAEISTEYAELSGSVNQLNKWQSGGARVLGVQVQAGGVGISLVRAKYAIWYSLPWSLAQYEQARARLVRPGQDRTVNFIHLIARLPSTGGRAKTETIDDVMLGALESRGVMIDAVLEALKR